jgi:phosphohistidine swiveling domain-containing protein
MKKYFIPLEHVDPDQVLRFGGKTCSLAFLRKHGLNVPQSIALGSEVFLEYLNGTGLGREVEKILKNHNLDEMRWEAIWDISLRIRNLFLKVALPPEINILGREAVARLPGASLLAVRSSAPGEDSGSSSFAGLHESHVPVQGEEQVREAVVRVWSSLWSDRALLYRRELDLDPLTSSMAVLVQECVQGEYSGVAFSIDPTDETRMVIESVPGMNSALVDGSTPPARWVMDRNSGRVLSFDPGSWDIDKYSLPTSGDLESVRDLALRCHKLSGRPQDVEWTMSSGTLYCLQSRPVTTSNDPPDPGQDQDKRPWYISLHRSFENLQALGKEIEKDLLPDLEGLSRKMGETDLAGMNNSELAGEINSRNAFMRQWRDTYYARFIPMAHGVRLLGMVYNDAIRPDDPFEFTNLLRGSGLEAVLRNQYLERLAAVVRSSPDLMQAMEKGVDPLSEPGNRDFKSLFEAFVKNHGSLLCSSAWCTEGYHGLFSLILEMAGKIPDSGPGNRKAQDSLPEQDFLNAFPPERRDFARAILELGRASHRIRDNDNLAMGRLQAELIRAADEGRSRLADQDDPKIRKALDNIPGEYLDITSPTGKSSYGGSNLSPQRDNVFAGHPAGPGLASGPARLIEEPSDLFLFREGEILVCQAMDPGMSFVVPLAAGIVEARGGMLVHGAIIAREYGLPCVTGLNESFKRIRTGDLLMVDGYRGIVSRREPGRN